MIDDRQEALLLAVQKNGLAFFDATDKVTCSKNFSLIGYSCCIYTGYNSIYMYIYFQTIIERYDFSQVEKWASGDKKITIDVKVNEERKKLEFETSLVCDLY